MEKRKCIICQGTGFANGELCACITGKQSKDLPNLPNGFKDIFGDIFGGVNAERFSKDPTTAE